MRVAVLGANGQIGQHIVKLLEADEQHDVVALVRKETQISQLTEQGINACLVDLTQEVAQIKNALEGVDAVIFSAGSGGDTDGDMTLRIDLDGAVKAMEAAELAGVKRFVQVSALQAHNREFWHPDITPYYIAKHYADRELMRSDLQYTIVRPGLLTNDDATGKVTSGSNIETGEIPRADVAKVIVELLDKPNAVGKAFDLVSGDTPISQAVQTL
ncbi:MAG: SDR family oxidoreductase [Idiomarina sp.]|nr:SDR family oxidoreductase [Idiomarina sp.]